MLRTTFHARFLAMAFLALGGGGTSACGPGGADRPDADDVEAADSGDVAPARPEAVELPERDAAALATLLARMTELRAAQGLSAAREALVQEFLAGPSPIASTRLGSDGTTIDLRFEDGLGAALLTDEGAFPDLPGASAPASLQGAPGWRFFASPLAPAEASICDDIVMPTSLKVHLVNLAGASNPATYTYVAEIEQTLKSLGWDESDIVVTTREAMNDRSITPDTLFDQEGYGLVFLIGHGAIHQDAGGADHFILQSFRGGLWSDGYQESVTSARFREYRQWLEDGELVEATAWNPTKQAYMPEIYVRDDRLAKEMKLDPGALVTFISCNSYQLSDELAAAGAGSVLGWDGAMKGPDGLATWQALLEHLVVAGGSDQDAVAALRAAGLGTSTDHIGDPTILRPGSDDHELYLPRTMTLTAGLDCLPTKAEGVEVTVSHPDCPEQDRTFVVLPGDAIRVGDLLPVGTEVRFQVKDAEGTTIAGGWYAVDPSVQGTAEDLCPCDGRVRLDLAPIPQDEPYAAASLHVEAVPDDPTVPARELEGALPSPSFADLAPGEFTFRISALAADGTVVAVTEVSAEARCDDAPAVPACFGWLEVSGKNAPADTAEIRVAVPGSSGALPPEVLLAPGSKAVIYGFAVGETVHLQAEARDGDGAVLATSAPVATVACGPTPVELDFSEYGIVLTAAPHRVAADGVASAAITAVVKRRRPDDLTAPTGDPLPGKSLAFDTTCGEFPGAASGTSDAQGLVSTTLVSAAPCLAAVRVFVTDEAVQSAPAYVSFDEATSFWIDGSGAPVTAEATTGTFSVSCATLRYYLRDALMIERTLNGEDLGWGAYMPRAAHPGDEIRLEFSRYDDDKLCTADAEHRIGPIWLHTAYPPDFTHQGLTQLSPGLDPLGATTTVQVTIEEIDYYVE